MKDTQLSPPLILKHNPQKRVQPVGYSIPSTNTVLSSLLLLGISHPLYRYSSSIPSTNTVCASPLLLEISNPLYYYSSPIPSTTTVLPSLLLLQFSNPLYYYYSSPIPYTTTLLPFPPHTTDLKSPYINTVIPSILLI